MKTIESTTAMKRLSKDWAHAGERVGFVPTMGALHDGHASLVETARKQCSKVVVSLFVNPTQFNDPKDFSNYPQPKERDLNLLNSLGVNAVFTPTTHEIYSDGHRFTVQENELTQVLCGPKRPGHFSGVLTVVLKLFNIVQPSRAYFGEKDFQQLRLIEDMARAFFLDTEIIRCPTVREADGLAMSSRNLLLSPAQRELAPVLYKILSRAPSVEEARHKLTQAGFRVDYVEEHWGRRFVAAFLGEVRLIDNVKI